MIFYLVMTGSLIFLIYQVRYLSQLRRRDNHLYELCQFRRDLISFLEVNNSEISSKDYIEARRLLETCNVAINRYKIHGKLMFDFRKFIDFVKTKSLAGAARKMHVVENEQLGDLKAVLNVILINGFFIHTPFLRYEVSVRAMIFALNIFLQGFRNKKSELYAQLNLLYEGLNFRLNMRGEGFSNFVYA